VSDYDETYPVCPADIEKDPDDTIRVPFEWAERLNGETISTIDYLLPDGLTEGASSGTGSSRSVLVSGGESGTYRVTCRITTSGNRQLDWTQRVLVRER
jgi:hypothetical protein